MLGKCPHCNGFEFLHKKKKIKEGDLFQKNVYLCSQCTKSITLPSSFFVFEICLLALYICSIYFEWKRMIFHEDDRIGQILILGFLFSLYFAARFLFSYSKSKFFK